MTVPTLRPALLTTGRRNAFGRAVFARMREVGVPPIAWVVEEPRDDRRLRDWIVRARREGAAAMLSASIRAARRSIGLGPPSGDALETPDSSFEDDRARAEELPRDLGEVAAAAGAPARFVPNLNGDAAVSFLREIGPTHLVLAGSRILKPPILSIPPGGTLNAHMALLPGRRGMNVAEWALWEGDETGVSVHLVDPGVDTGPVLVSRTLARAPGEGVDSLRRRLFALQVELLGEALVGLRDGAIRPRPQAGRGGRQYFAMHPRLRAALDSRLARSSPS